MVTFVLDIGADLVGFAEAHREGKRIEEQFIEYMYAGAQKVGMPRRKKK